jgi:small subunit ribosomal protein S6
MFLVHPQLPEGGSELDPVQRVLGRADAEVLVCKKWDERKLAYEIDKQRRGIYVLTYFKADGSKVAGIERDVQLAEDLLRVLVIRADDLTPEQMNAPTPAEAEQSSDGDDGDRDAAKADKESKPAPAKDDKESKAEASAEAPDKPAEKSADDAGEEKSAEDAEPTQA